MMDLTRLSAAERRVLLLLAQGHTAKSIAVRLDVSLGAVNERLREARRKTGAGSSRELARQVCAAGDEPPRNVTNKIGVAPTEDLANSKPPAARPWVGGPLSPGALALITLASAAGALVALGLAQGAGPAVHAAAPRVVATYPRADAYVAAGALRLSVTFDRPMRPDGYSFVTADAKTFPSCDGRPTQSADKRTFALRCVVQPQRRYEIGFNSARHHNFVGADSGLPAAPTMLRFSTR